MMLKLAAAAGLFFAFLAPNQGKKEEMQSVEITVHFPFYLGGDTGAPRLIKVEKLRTGFYWGDYSLYRFDPVIKFETDEPIKGTEKYFLVRGRSKLGYYFNPAKDSIHFVPMNADSVFDSWRWKADPNKHDPAFDERWIANKKKDSLVYLKHLKGKPADMNQPDSIILQFAKSDNDLPFSLGPGLDSLAGMKFYEMKIVFGERRVDSLALTIPVRTAYMRMKRIPVDDPEKEMRLIERFRKVCGL